MTLYIDIENKKLVQSLTSDRTVPAPVFMQGDNEPLEIHLLAKGEEELFEEKPLVEGTDFLKVAIARFKGFPKLLTYASGYTIENGVAEVVLPLNTTAIEQAVQDNEYVSAYLEVEYSNTYGKIVTVLQTACRVANDLVDNAPAVELQEQFYDKVYTDNIFSKKSANLSDIADKPAARENLGVYGKSEMYTQAEIDAQEALNLKKADNLSDLPDKALSRTNLNVYSKDDIDAQEALNLKKASNLSDVADVSAARANLGVPRTGDLSPFAFSGIYSAAALTLVGAPYDGGIGYELESNGKYTFLATYLGKAASFGFYSPYNSYSDIFNPSVNGQKFIVGTTNAYNDTSGYYEYQDVSFDLAKPFEFGDKIALTLDGRNFKLYKNTELVCEGTIPESIAINDPYTALSWNGLKKDLIYSKSIALPLTSAEGVSSKLNYSIEDFVNGKYPPKSLLSSRFAESKTIFASTYSKIQGGIRAEGGKSFGGKSNALKFSIRPQNYNTSHEFNLSSNAIGATGIQYRIKFNVYFPTDNPNITSLQLKIGTYTLAGVGTIISKTDTIDNNGYITAKNEWQQVDITIQSNRTGVPKLLFYNGSRTSYAISSETTDAVYFRDFYFYGLQGIDGFFYGNAESGIWKNFGSSSCNMIYSDGYSFPNDGCKIYTIRQNVASFSDSTYIYMDSFPSGFVLSQIVLKFDSDVPDTSELEDEYYRNIFQLYIGGTKAYSEQIPQVSQGFAYNIYPKKGFSGNVYSLEIYQMYSCQCSGTVDFIFTKTQ